MPRKRITQRFPFLLPLRRWQRKKLFYLKMRVDGNKYAQKRSEKVFDWKVFEMSVLMVNENSGFDIEFQYNKVYNLKLAAKMLDRIVIAPGETFSFWKLVKDADNWEPYKEALCFSEGKMTGAYGGGLCMLSDMLFWLFLHTPLTVIERHGHSVRAFPSTTEDLPCGTDAAVSEGWLDLKVRNETDNRFQVTVGFDDAYMYGCIFSEKEVPVRYEVYNRSVSYFRENGRVYQQAVVCRTKEEKNVPGKMEERLYCNLCEIAYVLPEEVFVEERR